MNMEAASVAVAPVSAFFGPPANMPLKYYGITRQEKNLRGASSAMSRSHARRDMLGKRHTCVRRHHTTK
jgi:hypothetical protein